MDTMDKILEPTGLKYDDLKPFEKETLNTWIATLQKSQVTPQKIRKYISAMKEGVEEELCKTTLDSRQDIYLKARLRNYLLIEAFLSTPEKAQAQLDQAIAGMVPKK